MKKKELVKFHNNDKVKFDKYVSPTINFFNSVAGSKTRPQKVGQLSNLFENFKLNSNTNSIDEWKNYYLSINNVLEDFPKLEKINGEDARNKAVDEIYEFMNNFKENIIPKIDRHMIELWVDDLLFTKTFEGLMLERPIATIVSKKILSDQNKKFNENNLIKSSKEEESKGIDYIYKESNTTFHIQIKSGSCAQNDYFRKKQESIPNISDNIYSCFYERTDKEYVKIKVCFKGREIYDI